MRHYVSVAPRRYVEPRRFFNPHHDAGGRFASKSGSGARGSVSDTDADHGSAIVAKDAQQRFLKMANAPDEHEEYSAMTFAECEIAAKASVKKYATEGDMTVYTIMNRAHMMATEWAVGSATGYSPNAATMLTAQRLFHGKADPGAPNMAHIPDKVRADAVADDARGPKTRLHAFRAIYDQTQATLAESGVKAVRVHRMVSFDTDKVPAELKGMTVGGKKSAQSELAPLSSFSASKEKVEQYASVFNKPGKVTFMIEGKVPAEHVVGIGGRTFGTPDIAEVVVRDHPFVGEFTRLQ